MADGGGGSSVDDVGTSSDGVDESGDTDTSMDCAPPTDVTVEWQVTNVDPGATVDLDLWCTSSGYLAQADGHRVELSGCYDPDGGGGDDSYTLEFSTTVDMVPWDPPFDMVRFRHVQEPDGQKWLALNWIDTDDDPPSASTTTFLLLAEGRSLLPNWFDFFPSVVDGGGTCPFEMEGALCTTRLRVRFSGIEVLHGESVFEDVADGDGWVYAVERARLLWSDGCNTPGGEFDYDYMMIAGALP